MKITTVKIANTLASYVLEAAFNDGLWRIFGFQSRPRRGHLFDRFIDQSLLEAEDFTLKELAVLATADIKYSIEFSNLSNDLKERILAELFFLTYTGLSSIKGFPKIVVWLRFLDLGLTKYSMNPIQPTLIDRIAEYLHPDRIETMTARISDALSEGPIGNNGNFILNRDKLIKLLNETKIEYSVLENMVPDELEKISYLSLKLAREHLGHAQ